MTSEAERRQFRAAAIALVVIALLTGAMIVGTHFEALSGPLFIPAVVAYFLFNLGFLFAAIRGHLNSRGAKVGMGAVTLNILAMLLSEFALVWTVLSLCALTFALLGAFLIFHDLDRNVAGAE